jgi:MFS transporter, putative metabolite:H+ symporter
MADVSAPATAPSRELFIAQLNARIDRLPRFGLNPMLFVLIGASYFFVFYDITVIGGTLPVLAAQYHWSNGQLALPVSMNLAGYMVGAYVLSTVADYWGRRWALAISCVLLTIGAVLTAISWDYASFVAFRAFTGLGMGAQISLAATMMTELASTKLRGRAIAYNVFWGACGLGAAPWVVLELLKVGSVGWRLSFAMGGLVVFVLFFLQDRFLPETPRWLVLHGQTERAEQVVVRMEDNVRAHGDVLPEPPPVSPEKELDKVPLLEILRPPYVSRVGVVFLFWFMTYMAGYAYLAYQPSILNNLHVGTPHGLYFSAIGDCSFPVGAIIVCYLIDKWDRKYLVVCAGFVGLIGLTLISLANGPTLIIIGSIIAGFWILSPALGYAYTAEVFPTRARATGMALGDGAGHGGAVVQPYIMVALLAGFSGKFTLWMIMAMLGSGMIIMFVGGLRTAGAHLTDLNTAQPGARLGWSTRLAHLGPARLHHHGA